MNMTQEQKNAFDQGARFSYSILAECVKKYYSSELKTFEEKRAFIFDIWGLVEEFSNGNFELYDVLEKTFKENNISEDETYFFEEGMREHNRYVKYCFQVGEFATVAIQLKDYFEGKTNVISAVKYSTFDEFVSE